MQTFQDLLTKAGIAKENVRLLRHTSKRVHAETDRTPYDMWRFDRPTFDLYQSIQKATNRPKLNAPFWAVFSATHNRDTLFLGLYSAHYLAPLVDRTVWPASLPTLEANQQYDSYQLALDERLREWIGKLCIEWGDSKITWIQYARNEKPILSNATDQEISDDLDALFRQPNISPTRIRTFVEARLGQGKFRSDVLALWNGRCAVTEVSTLVAIRASHIKPWRSATDSERLDPHNGLPLVASLDALFDAGLISFDDSGAMLISSGLTKRDRELFGPVGTSLIKEPSAATAAYLRNHRTDIYKP